ncbi:C39 family peptidase [Noviluteimonas gilva]|uniref:Peptidase C39 n=1 Tax=Noviluteimonas gilva TaxID=2682097 RepID=A0A7C9HKE5_9GAMM|nr:C39 family peptidase [Lysobacter gilvus]MUV12852.1 peptidase C39 [Lysobacter gilvus]
MTTRRARWHEIAALALALGVGCAHAGSLALNDGSGDYKVRVTSLKEARFATVVRQRYDFSCGSAAVATLLTHHFGRPVREEDVFAEMYAHGDQARIRKLGFSLLDMRRYLQSHGFRADGFSLPIDKLAEEGVPAIVLLNDRGYRHFVVVKGMRGNRVLVGDPAAGLRTIRRDRFETLWESRVLFVVHNHRELAQFNNPRDWRIAPAGPLELSIQRDGLQHVVMPRRGPGDV